jgi:hypothetical protein
MFAFSSSLNAYSNMGVIAVVIWQVLFVSVPMIFLAIRLQVIVALSCMATAFFLCYYEWLKPLYLGILFTKIFYCYLHPRGQLVYSFSFIISIG